MADLDALLQKVADLIIGAGKIVVFTGAGISTESGIPDFRSPGGIWERFNPDDFTYDKFLVDPVIRSKHWQLLADGIAREAKPNSAHYAIGELHKMDKLDCVITQNVDNLHQRGGVPDNKVFELHGSMRSAVCLGCGVHYPMEQVRERLNAGEKAPDCAKCHGILKPDVVMFGEALPESVLEEASYRAGNCDLFIVIGSTLVVYPAASVPMRAVRSRADLVIINLSPTPMDELAEVLIRAKAGETMSKIIHIVKQKLNKL